MSLHFLPAPLIHSTLNLLQKPDVFEPEKFKLERLFKYFKKDGYRK